MQENTHFTLTGPIIWCDNLQVRLWMILNINYNVSHHMGMSQMCTGADHYFRSSKPHSGKLWYVLFMSAVIGSFSQVSSCHVQLFIEYFISYMKMKDNAHLHNKFSPLDKCTIPTVEILKPCVHGVLIDASCSRNSLVQVRTYRTNNEYLQKDRVFIKYSVIFCRF